MKSITPERLGNEMIRVAGAFVGLREVKPNAKWDNPKTPGPDQELNDRLLAMMKPSPWEPGWAYCAAFAEGVCIEAMRNVGFSESQVKLVQAKLTAHVMTTCRNFTKANKLSLHPSVGGIWLAEHGTSDKGHCGIMTATNTDGGTKIATIEANTSKDATDADKDREGDWITTRLFALNGRGILVTRGFINPISIIEMALGK